jgi:hypothetical protein
MYDLSGVIQSISFVALRGTDIMGACAILGDRGWVVAVKRRGPSYPGCVVHGVDEVGVALGDRVRV